MRRIVKRVALTLGALVLTLIVLWFIGIRWGFTPLQKPPRGVRIEPLSPPIARKDLKPDNGAFYYAKAADFLNQYKQSRESEEQMDALLAGDFPGGIKAIEHTLSDCREVLDLGRNGSSMNSCQMPWLGLRTDLIGLLTPLRRAARLLVTDGRIAEHKGDADRAISDYLAVVKLGTDCSKGGTIILSLVGTAITSMGTQAIRAWALQNATSPTTLENVIEKLNRIDGARVPFAETLRYELAFAKEQFDSQILTQWKPWQRAFFSKRVLYRCFDAAYGDLIQDAEKPFWESNSTLIVEKWWLGDASIWFPNRPLPRIVVHTSLLTIESRRSKSIRTGLEVEGAIVTCALKQYELTHGNPPEQIAELVPDYLTSIPIDPFNGKPLRYRREGKGWVIWSVGSDLKDDSATWHEFKYHKRDEKWKGEDIYFKSTEPQDDLAAHRASLKTSSNSSD